MRIPFQTQHQDVPALGRGSVSGLTPWTWGPHGNGLGGQHRARGAQPSAGLTCSNTPTPELHQRTFPRAVRTRGLTLCLLVSLVARGQSLAQRFTRRPRLEDLTGWLHWSQTPFKVRANPDLKFHEDSAVEAHLRRVLVGRLKDFPITLEESVEVTLTLVGTPTDEDLILDFFSQLCKLCWSSQNAV